jgi:hypothetical protein
LLDELLDELLLDELLESLLLGDLAKESVMVWFRSM